MHYASYFFAVSIGTIISSCSNEESNVELDVLEKMEYETHHANCLNLYQQGNTVLMTFKAEKGALQATDPIKYARQIKAVDMSLNPMKEIEKLTANLMQQIDSEKRHILRITGSSNAISKFSYHQPNPAKIDASKLNGDKENVFHSKKLLKQIEAYRNAVIDGIANSHYRYENSELIKVAFLDLNAIKNLKLRKEDGEIQRILSVLSSAHSDDKNGLAQLIYDITPSPKENRSYSARGALKYLSLLETRILAARKSAFALFNFRISYTSYSFDKIVPIVSGPDIVEKGNEVEFQIMLAAIDTYNDPIVTCDQKAVIETRNGIAYLKMSLSESTTLSGTIARENKQGQLKTQQWKKDIIVQ